MPIGTFNPHTSSGHVRNINAAWATCRNAADGDATDSTGATSDTIAAHLNVATYEIYRFFDKFLIGTETVPVGATITDATYRKYLNAKGTVNDFNLVTSAHTAPDTTLGTGDFDALTVNSPAEYSERSALVSTIGTGTFIEFALNVTGKAAVSPGNYFKIALRSSKDVDNSTPTDVSYALFNGHAAANPPELIVTYTTGGVTPTIGYRNLLGVGQ